MPQPMPEPPYYAVIFVSRRPSSPSSSPAAVTPQDHSNEYDQTATRMVQLAEGQPGFLGLDSARNPDGLGITVSYWSSLEAIAAWRQHAEHRLAQDRGNREWYLHYELHVARVERSYQGPRAAPV